MEGKDRELVERAEEVEGRLWWALGKRLGKEEKDLLYLGAIIQLGRMLLARLLLAGPGYDEEEMRETLRENLEVAEALLGEVVGRGG